MLVKPRCNRYSAFTQIHFTHEPTTLHVTSPRSLARDHLGNHCHDLGRTAWMGETWRTSAYPLLSSSSDDPVEPDVPAQDAVGTQASGTDVRGGTPLTLPGTMASNAIIYKAALQIADMDRQYFQDHALTLARHPSETEERLMVRVLAFALHADEALSFGRGVSAEDEPALWQRDVTGAIDLWIEVGQPDEKILRQACGRSKQVIVYIYGTRSAEVWWANQNPSLDRLKNLAVTLLPMESVRALAGMAKPTMQLQWTIQDGHLWIADGVQTLHLELQQLKT